MAGRPRTMTLEESRKKENEYQKAYMKHRRDTDPEFKKKYYERCYKYYQEHKEERKEYYQRKKAEKMLQSKTMNIIDLMKK